MKDDGNLTWRTSQITKLLSCRVYVWERMNLDKRDLKEKHSKPLWTLEEERKGEQVEKNMMLIFIHHHHRHRFNENHSFLSNPLGQVKDMVATSTKLVLIRQSSITSLDFWEGGHHVREVFKPQKSSNILPPTSASKSKSTLAPQILGKRRLARESTKVKRRCCAFC